MDNVERVRTYEELLMSRIGKSFEAMDTSNEALFDEILDQLEMIFNLVPDLGEEYFKHKEALTKLAQEGYLASARKIEKMEDDYMRKIQKEIDDSTISWDYRKDLIESALKIMGKYNMIPFSNPVFAELEPAEMQEEVPEEPVEEPEPVEEVEPVEQPEQPIQRRPHKRIKFRMRKANSP